jgi:hypothetical protein
MRDGRSVGSSVWPCAFEQNKTPIHNKKTIIRFIAFTFTPSSDQLPVYPKDQQLLCLL